MADSKGNLFICGQPGSPQPQKLTLAVPVRERSADELRGREVTNPIAAVGSDPNLLAHLDGHC